MFNPKISFDLSSLWDILPSVYKHLPPEEKTQIEGIWESYFKGLHALNYNLHQNSSISFLTDSNGYLESSYEDFKLIYAGPNKTLYKKTDALTLKINSIRHSNTDIYLAAYEGVFKASTDDYLWEELGTQSFESAFNDVIFDGNDLYGASDSGVWKYSDTSKTWAKLLDGSYLSVIPLNAEWLIYGPSEILYTKDWLDFTSKTTNISSLIFNEMVLIGDDLFVSTSEGIYTAYKEDLEWSSVGTISTNVSSVISYNNKIYIGKQDGVYSTDIASNYSNSTWTLDYSTSDHVKAIRAGTYIYALTNGSVFSNRDGSWALFKDIDDYGYKTLDVIEDTLYLTGLSKGIEIHTSTEAISKNDSHYYYDLPTEMDYLSIKSLSSMYTDNTLLEGVDYDIENFSTIKFKKRFGNSNSDKLIMLPSFDESDYPTDIYTSISGVVLNPVIKELYKPALGSSNPTKDLLTRFYTPFTKEHREESNEHEKTKIWANHVHKWVHASVGTLRQSPTIDVYKQSYEILRGLPFAYEESTVESIDVSSNPKSLTLQYTDSLTDLSVNRTYEIPIETDWKPYVSGQKVSKFEVLVSGVEVYDYKKDFNVISGLVDTYYEGNDKHPEKYLYLFAINETNRLQYFDYSQEIVDNFVDNLTPAHLTTFVYNLAPTVSTSSDKDFYASSDTAQLSSLTSDPEDDILYYRWKHTGPFNNYIEDLSYTVDINDKLASGISVEVSNNLIVDSAISFDLEVSDLYNTVTDPITIYVSGTNQFDNWSAVEFKVGDLNIPFNKITEMNGN